MLTGVNKSQVIEYVSALDKDASNPTKFLLGVMSGEDRFVVASAIEESDPKVMYGIVKKGLKGIKNFNFADKVQDITDITDEVLDSIPTVVVTELFRKIFEMNFLSEQEVKN